MASVPPLHYENFAEHRENFRGPAVATRTSGSAERSRKRAIKSSENPLWSRTERALLLDRMHSIPCWGRNKPSWFSLQRSGRHLDANLN